METFHRILNTSATNLKEIENKTVALIVTSPPYPMIEMWNESFSNQDEEIRVALDEKNFDKAFYLMHSILNSVWLEVDRVLINGGFACINIGDATKNCDGDFKLFPNHTQVITFFMNHGYSVLPDIIWRKQTNAPNKFMGSGMYPAGAYVTFEHEYILIFRKGSKREFTSNDEKLSRRKSAYFWEERNIWFSDVWDFKGANQTLKLSSNRNRSGAFPFELAYRLINMYSVKGDIVLDPFVGTGTTLFAALASERNSFGCEIDKELCFDIFKEPISLVKQINETVNKRLSNHLNFTDMQI
ncbi:MAG: site-specific DNA-methyltransferase, partial [Erysipelotrichaceae bacterium]